MDYQGNYFPKDKDENESKTYRTIKGIIKWTMYGISFIIYALIFYILIANRDSDILERNFIKDVVVNDFNAEDTVLYQINTRVFMNDDGSLQTINVNYSDEFNLLEIGIKYNARKLTNGAHTDALDYILYDNEGNKYSLVNIVQDSSRRYGFARICFSDIEIDLDSNDLRYDSEKPDKPRSNVTYYLDVVRKTDNSKLFSFEIYNNKTTFTKTEYTE